MSLLLTVVDFVDFVDFVLRNRIARAGNRRQPGQVTRARETALQPPAKDIFIGTQASLRGDRGIL